MFSQEEVFQSNTSGKWFMGISALMMTLFLYKDLLGVPEMFLWGTYGICVILFFVSTYEYFRRYLRYFKKLENR